MIHAGKVLRFSASAGSGKTHALTGFYLSKVLFDPTAYKRILAVTFTNSAAAEMKGRILSELYKLASGGDSDFISFLRENFPETMPESEDIEVKLRKNASLALKNILHDYSRFSVGTIDSFFQRVIRAFAREIDIPSGYEIELEHDMLLGDAVEELLKEVATDPKLREWITSYIESRLDDNRSWDVRRDIMDVAKQIFREEFRQLDKEERRALGDYQNLKRYSENVYKVRNGFEADLRELATKGVHIFENSGISASDFYQGEKGIGGWLNKYRIGNITKPNNYWNSGVNEGKYLKNNPSPFIKTAMDNALSQGLAEVVEKITSLFEKQYPLYVAAQAQVKTIHVMGILGSISEKVRLLAHDENIFLLSDSGELINRLIADDDTPFIYEKIGAAYDHYIIDEFQDTSQIQWRNFMPLIAETLSRGKENLVVGDVKQSIYRWRNGDWKIIHSEVQKAFGEDAVSSVYLDTNYRSRSNIIRFNNRLFSPGNLPALCDSKIAFEPLRIADVYNEAVQKETPGKQGGCVRVKFYKKSDSEKWIDNILRDLPALIEELQDHGYHASDIMLLCRKNDEGKRIINRILEYSSSCPEEKKIRYNFEVTSGESLYLERNPAVSLLVSCLRYLVDPGNRINRSLMVRCYALAMDHNEASIYAADISTDIPDEIFPEDWKAHFDTYRNLSLFSATEKMINLFALGKRTSNVAYLNSFQDVIIWYSSRYTSDIASFVAWWELDGHKRTVTQSDRQEAIKVMTIHKAKGLQSKVVIIPFASWEYRHPGFSRPLLWIRKVPVSFGPMPVVLPEYSTALEESVFSGEAGMEKASVWLDGVNMLYVACTRAVDALFIMAPDTPGDTEKNSSTSNLLTKALNEGVEGVTWTEDENTRQLIFGELPGVVHEDAGPMLTLSEYVVSDRPGIMRLRTGGAMPLDDVHLSEENGRVYGIVMHELLSCITSKDDIDIAISRLVDEGIVMSDETIGLSEKMKTLLSGEKVKEWFDGSCIVHTEASVLLPSGSTRRPDRVMINGEKVIVVDFKFGEPEKKHAYQTAEYKHILDEMGYKNVEAYLWYIEKEIIELINK